MDTKLTVENGIFFRWIFFAGFAEISASFFSVLIFLAAGFSSLGSLAIPSLVRFDFRTDEATTISPEVLELQGTFSS